MSYKEFWRGISDNLFGMAVVTVGIILFVMIEMCIRVP